VLENLRCAASAKAVAAVAVVVLSFILLVGDMRCLAESGDCEGLGPRLPSVPWPPVGKGEQMLWALLLLVEVSKGEDLKS